MALATLTIDINARLANIEQDLGKLAHLSEQSAQRMSSAFNAAKLALGGFIGSIAGGLTAGAFVAMVKGNIDAADSLNDLSQSVGINIKDLATWTLAANQSGTSLESVAKGVKGLSTFIVENGDALKKAGITATDANGALIQLADLFKALPDGVEKSALAVKLFGKAGLEMIPLLNQGSEGLADAAEKSRKYGERMALLAPLADKFNDQLAEIALQSKETGIAITTVLMPGLIGMATRLNDLQAGGDRAAKSLEFLSDKSPLFAGLVKLHELFNGGQSRSQGFSGEKNALGLPISGAEKSLRDLQAFDAATEAYMKERAAKAKALGLLGKSDKATNVAEKRNAELERFLKIGQQNLMGTLDSEEEQRLLAHKREIADITEAYGKLNAMIAATPTGILEKSRDDMQLLAKAFEDGKISEDQFSEAARTRLGQTGEAIDTMTEFVRQAARNMQDAMAEGFFDIMQVRFDQLGNNFKATLDRMVANAIAADLSNRLLGDFGKTGKIGGWAGDLLGSLFKPGYGDIAGVAAGVPQFAEGTPYVPSTGLALIHQGERIIPADQNRGGFGGTINITINGAGNAQDVRRAAGQGAREALAAFSGAQRYA